MTTVRFARLALVLAGAHLALSFLLFSLVWFLPDEGLHVRTVGATTDLLFQPFFGPRRLIDVPSAWLAWGAGLPLTLGASLLWGLGLAALVRLARVASQEWGEHQVEPGGR